MCYKSHRVAARGTSLHIHAVHFDISAGAISNAQRCVSLVECVVAAEVESMPRVGERHPCRELAVETD